MERIDQLISDYLDGQLDDAGVERLAQALRQDVAHVDHLVLNSFVHSQLYHWMNVRQIRDEILADAFGGADSNGCATLHWEDDEAARHELNGESINAGGGSKLPSRRRWLGMFAALATTILLAVTLSAAYVAWSRPVIVAQLTETTNCQWHRDSADLPAGSLLHAGQQLRLDSGRALLTFASGARLVLEGPSTVNLASTSEVDLGAGNVAAQVPTLAIGFTVTTPEADFVDLGTEFSLKLESDNSCELQVFDGLVELRMLEQDGQGVKQRLQISEGSAVRLDAARRDVTSVHYNESQRVTF